MDAERRQKTPGSEKKPYYTQHSKQEEHFICIGPISGMTWETRMNLQMQWEH